jgi:hypothetical protein
MGWLDPDPANYRSSFGLNKAPRDAGAPCRLPSCRAYLDWEFGLVDQLLRDGTHGFFLI